MRLLLVEDSNRLRDLLSETLRSADFSVDAFSTAKTFLCAATSGHYNLFIIDLGLPDGDGLDLIRDVRGAGINTPILVITARAAIDDRVVALEGGADDYCVKPFNHRELLARVRALLRRPSEMSETVVRVGMLAFNQTSGEFFVDEAPLQLRPSERRLLGLLMRRVGRVVPKSLLEESLSGFGRELSTNALETIISRLRKALDEAQAHVVIETIRGIGYALRQPRS
jgi:two-component system response regulator TctD